jgi:SAM-dependent methyltransferase
MMARLAAVDPMPELYGPDFFDAMAPVSLSSARAVWPLLLSLLGRPRSVVDFGCGPAAWLAALHELVPNAELVGVDHPGAVDHPMLIQRAEFIGADLTKSIDLERSFDLCLSLEVAEHLPETAAGIFVETLTRHADSIVFSAAIPAQGGTGHLNEQWPTYWRQLFAQHGFRCVDCIRPAVWDNEAVDRQYRQNMMLFLRSLAEIDLPDWGCAHLVHPDNFLDARVPLRPARTFRNLWRFVRRQPLLHRDR